MPLTLMQIGDRATVSRIGGNEDTRRYLMNLGFVNAAELEVVNRLGGNVIVSVKDARIALNADMAKHIMVDL
ncbi:MAG: ferrous iron transport protein A [Spirochaetes bacterium]|uniref:Ferrous iron transport protein A n=1 Tax=Candidatus Aphodenecus pullistercoris TaxID=2840669 RepID=A0A9D9EDF7_9SPIR|nr:ferrous iron transport protein A [Candidatus Aphodenecus pullistercoris]